MKLSISREELDALVSRQVANLFVLRESEQSLLRDAIADALERTEYCFSKTENKYYSEDGKTYFNPFHSGQYCIFLYFLSVAVFTREGRPTLLADRIYYLNKSLNGLDIFYQVQMPRVFMLDHPLGSVMGRATYGEFFQFSQNCTVGNNHGIYPSIGAHVTMMSGSKLIGDSTVGHHAILAANTFVKDANIPSRSIVFGSSPELIIKPRSN